ncbi:MAG TPA: HTH domain-containing protein [Planctomycetota bacterium]|jgi:biotin operon repressor|nr:HTH domain-containing protein [Planctomycetota bacterium]
MSTRVAKRKDVTPTEGELVRNLRLHIRCRPHTTDSLARKLGVSTATVARGLATLRRLLSERGESLVSIKEATVWHYQIREREDVWENDPLLAAVGTVRGTKRAAGESVDDALYGKARPAR